MLSGVLMRHLRQCIHQRSAFPCLLLCSFVHLRQCMLWASIGKPVQSVVFYCPQAHGSLVFVTVPFSFWVVPPPNLPCFNCIIITLSAWRVPFFPFAWGLMAGSPGFASHGSSLIKALSSTSGSSWMSGAVNLHLAILLLTDKLKHVCW